MKKKADEIKRHWDEQGKLSREGKKTLEILDEKRNVFKDAQGGTLKDYNLRECEIRALGRYLTGKRSVLDIGCGNGFATIELAKRHGGIEIRGTDYSEEMIRSAEEILARQEEEIKSRVGFEVMDVLEPRIEGTFDVAMTQRCLINLDTWEKQKEAIRNVLGTLEPGGLFLMLEGSLQGLANLNELRRRVGLDEIPVAWHNLFFDEGSLIGFIEEEPGTELLDVDNFASTYMMISRVVHPAVMEPSYDAKINRIALEMPNHGENGYLKIFVIRRSG